MSTPEDFSQRVIKLRQKLGLSQDGLAKRLGVSRNYVSMVEGGRLPSEALQKLILTLEDRELRTPGFTDDHVLREDPAPYGLPPSFTVRAVPVLSWAHAGAAVAYEELPQTWQGQTWTTSRNTQSFALAVEGDSMMPHCLPGDLVVLSPGEEPRNGQLVVAKLKDDGIILRRYTRLNASTIRLTAYNPVYPAVDYPTSAFHWIYPVDSLNRRNP